MRPSLLLLALAALPACDDNTDATLGACATPTTEWWPLRPGVVWQYEQIEFGRNTTSDKVLEVQYDRSAMHGLLGDETAVRTWRADRDRGDVEPYEAGFRWFLATDDGFGFRRDIWVDADTAEAPCTSLVSDGDLAGCEELAPLADVTYFPMRIRLDLTPERLCARSEWSSTFVERTIEIGLGPGDDNPDLDNCAEDTWRTDVASCPALEEETTDRWDVQYVDHTIDVPAGHFEHCLCVRRQGSTSNKTYCFAKGVGKVYELDRNNLVECLSAYRIDNDTAGPPADWRYDCDSNQVEW